MPSRRQHLKCRRLSGSRSSNHGRHRTCRLLRSLRRLSRRHNCVKSCGPRGRHAGKPVSTLATSVPNGRRSGSLKKKQTGSRQHHGRIRLTTRTGPSVDATASFSRSSTLRRGRVVSVSLDVTTSSMRTRLPLTSSSAGTPTRPIRFRSRPSTCRRPLTL